MVTGAIESDLFKAFSAGSRGVSPHTLKETPLLCKSTPNFERCFPFFALSPSVSFEGKPDLGENQTQWVINGYRSDQVSSSIKKSVSHLAHRDVVKIRCFVYTDDGGLFRENNNRSSSTTSSNGYAVWKLIDNYSNSTSETFKSAIAPSREAVIVALPKVSQVWKGRQQSRR